MSAELAPAARTLYTGAATGSGTWVDMGQWNLPAGITFLGTFGTDSFQIMVSNADPKPLDATDGIAYGAAVTAQGKVALTETYKWVKVKKTAGTADILVQAFAQVMIQA